jgi:hypothetical protein
MYPYDSQEVAYILVTQPMHNKQLRQQAESIQLKKS